jgi:hypothetical protein
MTTRSHKNHPSKTARPVMPDARYNTQTEPVSNRPRLNPDQLLIGCIAIVLSISGYLYYIYASRTAEYGLPGSAKNSERKPTKNVSKTQWQTFKNDAFTFRYPPELNSLIDKSNKDDQGKYLGAIFLQNFDIYGSIPANSEIFQMVLFMEPDTEVTLEQYAQSKGGSSLEKTRISQEEALRGISVDSKANQNRTTTWIKHSGILYEIQASIPSSTNADWYDQILETFEFTN